MCKRWIHTCCFFIRYALPQRNESNDSSLGLTLVSKFSIICRAAIKKMEALNSEISEMKQQVKEVDERNHSLRWKRKELNEDHEGLRARVEAGQREGRQLLKEQEVHREEEAELMGNRYRMSYSVSVKNEHYGESFRVGVRCFVFVSCVCF